jgi:beta-lactamase regulating signal transducer with metallopeptidase domain
MIAYLPFDEIELWHIAGWTMVHFLWLGAIVAAAGFLSRVLLRRAAPNLRYAAALGCLLILAALPPAIAAWLVTDSPPVQREAGGQFVNDVAHHEPIVAAAPETIELHTENAPQAPPVIADELADVEAAQSLRTEPSPNPSLQGWGISFTNLESFVPYLPWLWIIGTPATFALLAAGLVGTKRLRQASRAMDDSQITEILKRIAASLRVRVRVGIAVCDRIAAPVLIGILRPIILLPPAAITGWSPDEIEMVLLHELAHVRRWDNLVNLLQRCIESLLFFHPAVWLVSNWARREREACCDAVVVGRTQRPHAYAELLVALAAQMPRSVLFHPAASSAMAAGPLRKRIRRILQLDDDPMLISGKSFTLVLAGLIFAATLAVLYLPAVGQAEESTTEATESTETSNEKDSRQVDRLHREPETGERSDDREPGANSTSREDRSSPTTEDELKLLREHVKNLDHQFKRVDALHKAAARGGSEDARELAAYELTLAHGELALAEGNPKRALTNFSEARMHAEKALKAVEAQHQFGKLTQDRVLEAQRNLLDIQLKIARLQNKMYTSETETAVKRNTPTNSELPYRVDFAEGASRFLDGDKIKIVEVRGTARTFEPGNIYRIKGTYTLASHDRAQLSAFTTAKEAKDATGPVWKIQTTTVNRGKGTFELFLPMSVNGWPHVSFYPADGGEGFGGIYFGTGDSVLKKWWGSDQVIDKLDANSTPNEPARIVIAYEIPIELLDDVRQQVRERQIYGVWDERERFIMQASREGHERFSELLEATPKWRDPAAARQRAQQPVVKKNIEGTPALEWRSLGLTFAAETRPEFLTPRGPGGVEVVAVAPGSPAAWQKIKPGDVLVGIENFKTGSIAELQSVIKTLLEGFSSKNKKVQTSWAFLQQGQALNYKQHVLPLRPDDPDGERAESRSTPTTSVASSKPGDADVPPFVLPSPDDEADLPKKPPVIPGATPSSDTDRKRRTRRPTPISAASGGKESLRYDGKTFDEWRNQWQNELSNEKRAEAVKALAAFGRAGYGKEATEAILDVAGNYDFYSFTNDDAEMKLKETIIKELVQESDNRELSKYWLPELVSRLKRDPEKWKGWAFNLLHKVYTADPAGQTLLKSLAHEGPSEVRSAALGALIRASRSPDRKLVLDEETHKLLRDALQSDDRMMVQYALQYLTYPTTAGVEPATLLFQPELIPLLFHADEYVQRNARGCLQYLDKKDAPEVLDQLTNALEDSAEKPDRRLAAIRALGAMGEKAESAIPSLKDLVKPSADESTLIAMYVALDAITREKHKRNYTSFGIGEFTEDLSGDDKKAVREKMEYGSPKFNGSISQEMQAVLPQQLGGGGGFF